MLPLYVYASSISTERFAIGDFFDNSIAALASDSVQEVLADSNLARETKLSMMTLVILFLRRLTRRKLCQFTLL